jgi:hypothetical protein
MAELPISDLASWLNRPHKIRAAVPDNDVLRKVMGGRVDSHSRFRENRSHGRKRNEDPGPQAGASHLHGPSSSKTNFTSSPSPPLTYATAPMHHPMLLQYSPLSELPSSPFAIPRSRHSSVEPDNSPAEHSADMLQINPKPLQSVRGTKRTISEDDTMDDAERRKIFWIAIQDSVEQQWLCFKDQRNR